MPDLWNSIDPGNIVRAHLLHHRIEIDYLAGTNPIYVGWALPGSTILEQKWRICKLTFDGNNNPTAINWADGTNQYIKVWNDRATYSYIA